MGEISYVFNIQRYSLHDGPGIRTIIFLKGCPMRCRWCCNPESQERKPEIFYTESKCIGSEECGFCKNVCPEKAIDFKGKAVIDRKKCINCLKCEAVCPSKAVSVQGRQYTVDELLDIAEKDSIFYGNEGGLTVSGGEPLSHGDFLIQLLKEARKRRINTATETCGCGDYEVLYEAAKNLDYILFDIKSLNNEKHRKYTGCDNKVILNNFKRLCRDFPSLKKRVRTPVIPGFNDSTDDIKAVLDFIKDFPNVSYEPLKYHSFGRGKYSSLGREYELGDISLDENIFEEIKNIVKKAGF
ncbi:MAG: glycyl-radical enzyme activating protein [Clostridiales bacterium]|nr:glycyl-radical enzyme activating protein [Clostridiales bacterium]